MSRKKSRDRRQVQTVGEKVESRLENKDEIASKREQGGPLVTNPERGWVFLWHDKGVGLQLHVKNYTKHK